MPLPTDDYFAPDGAGAPAPAGVPAVGVVLAAIVVAYLVWSSKR